MNDIGLRIADGLIALLWAVILVQALASGWIGFRREGRSDRAMRPVGFWATICLFALMVVHFAGLAMVGQMR